MTRLPMNCPTCHKYELKIIELEKEKSKLEEKISKLEKSNINHLLDEEPEFTFDDIFKEND